MNKTKPKILKTNKKYQDLPIDLIWESFIQVPESFKLEKFLKNLTNQIKNIFLGKEVIIYSFKIKDKKNTNKKSSLKDLNNIK